MRDKRILARNWVAWVGLAGAAAAMGVSVEEIKGLIAETKPSKSTRSSLPSLSSQSEVETIADGKRKRYTPEQKDHALARVSEIGLAAASRETGISVGSLMKWRQEANSSSPT